MFVLANLTGTWSNVFASLFFMLNPSTGICSIFPFCAKRRCVPGGSGTTSGLGVGPKITVGVTESRPVRTVEGNQMVMFGQHDITPSLNQHSHSPQIHCKSLTPSVRIYFLEKIV